MRKRALGAMSTIAALTLLAPNTFAQGPANRVVTKIPAIDASSEPLVEFEMMTWPEVKVALAAGKTTALSTPGVRNSADRRT